MRAPALRRRLSGWCTRVWMSGGGRAALRGCAEDDGGRDVPGGRSAGLYRFGRSVSMSVGGGENPPIERLGNPTVAILCCASRLRS